MPRVSLISSMPPVVDYIGPPAKAAGWYGPTSGLHTISIKTKNLRGTLTVQGTLSPTPTEQDWFPILLGGQSSIIFPRAEDRPWNFPGWFGDTVTLGYNFVCNCLYLRAQVIRSNMLPLNTREDVIAYYGAIDTIFVRY